MRKAERSPNFPLHALKGSAVLVNKLASARVALRLRRRLRVKDLGTSTDYRAELRIPSVFFFMHTSPLATINSAYPAWGQARRLQFTQSAKFSKLLGA